MQDNINGLGEMAGRNTTSCWDTFFLVVEQKKNRFVCFLR